jgi:hypothetical protein
VQARKIGIGQATFAAAGDDEAVKRSMDRRSTAA